MHTYHVTYYYNATGMEGMADYVDHGYVQAWSPEEALEKVGYELAPFERNKAHREWGLGATLVRRDYSKIKDI